jgi:chromosomal replication initiator protein
MSPSRLFSGQFPDSTPNHGAGMGIPASPLADAGLPSQLLTPQLLTQWVRVRAALKQEFGAAAYKSWLQPLTLVGQADDAVILAMPTRFMCDWIQANYRTQLAGLWHQENPAIRRVEVMLAAGPMVAPADVISGDEQQAELEQAAVLAAAGAEAPLVGSKLDPRYSFDNFIVGKSNEFAYAAARRVAESDKVTFNPLFLHGGVGLGKTHLMHALAWDIRRKFPTRTVVYLSAETFMYQFIRALRDRNTMDFKARFRNVDVLMIDDFQFIGGKEATQEEFFHTFNALADENRQIIISADKSPSELDGLEERLRSRLGWGLVADIHPTTYELRLGILQAKAEAKQSPIPQEVLEFIAHKISSNVRQLEGALNRLIAHADFVGGDITIDRAQDLLQDMLRAANRRQSIEDIQKQVAEHFNIKAADMHSTRRARTVARPRQIAMYLAKELTTCSLPEIGRKFGGRDHTTVLHAVRRIEELIATDPHLAEDLMVLRRTLQG